MKAFRQIIQEVSANDKLDKFGHNKPLSGSRLNQLTRDFSAYEDIDLDQNSEKAKPIKEENKNEQK